MNVHTKARYAVYAALVAVATVAFAGCGGGGGGGNGNGSLTSCLGYGGGGGGGGGGSCQSGGPTPAPGAQMVALMLTGENPVSVAPFGDVLGYVTGSTSAAFGSGSNVVNLTANGNVQFYNVDPTAANVHTASSLGAWSGSFPPSGPTSAQQNASTAGTAISASGFSTGTLQPNGGLSKVYSTGAPGMTVIGCFYHYISNNMRTVLIVQ